MPLLTHILHVYTPCMSNPVPVHTSLAADVKNAPGSVYNGAPQKDKADVTITVSDQVFLDVAAGKTSTEEVR